MCSKLNYTLNRRDVVNRLLGRRTGLLVVSGLGAPSWDVAAVGDNALNFTLWGAMGGTVSLGLGLALAQPSRKVMVITGDGEMLMGLGSLATVAVQAPVNLSIIVLDNEHYGETGMQKTHTATTVDLAAVARSTGFRKAKTVSDNEGLRQCLVEVQSVVGPCFYCIKVITDTPPLVLPPRDGKALTRRFKRALLGCS